MPTAKPKISIITVCYNSASTIEDTLQSIKMQDYDNLEHVVIDGGSTDETMKIVDRYKDGAMICLSEADRGVYDGCNKGLTLASGDVVGFLNSDDFYPAPDVISRVAKVFRNSSIDACYGDLCYVGQFDVGRVVRYWRSGPFKPGLFARGWVPPHPTFFVRKHIYDELGGFNLNYKIAADWELLARFLEVHQVRAAYQPMVMVHMRLGGLSNRSWSNVWNQNKEIWRASKTHGLKLSLLRFAGSKVLSRGLQFLRRRKSEP